MHKITYQDQEITFSVSNNNIHIVDSYKIHNQMDMWEILKIIKEFCENEGYTYVRDNLSWLHEWGAHNWLYEKGISQERTGSVDLNETEGKFRLFVYKILSRLYFNRV